MTVVASLFVLGKDTGVSTNTFFVSICLTSPLSLLHPQLSTSPCSLFHPSKASHTRSHYPTLEFFARFSKSSFTHMLPRLQPPPPPPHRHSSAPVHTQTAAEFLRRLLPRPRQVSPLGPLQPSLMENYQCTQRRQTQQGLC